MIIKEEYFGKNKNLLDMEETFNKAIKEGKTAKEVANIIDKSGSLKKIGKQFGFTGLDFFIDTRAGYNAYTFCNYNDINDIKVELGGGYKVTKDSDYGITVVFMKEMFNGTLTGGELMAVFLHEIGHHFSAKARLNNLNSQPTVDFLNGVRELHKVFKLASKNESVSITEAVYSSFSILKNLSVSAFHALKVLLNTILFLSYATVSTPIKFISNLKGAVEKNAYDFLIKKIYGLDRLKKNTDISSYDMEEEKSDSFAVIYGYGPELSSGLSKLENAKLVSDYNEIDNDMMFHTLNTATVIMPLIPLLINTSVLAGLFGYGWYIPTSKRTIMQLAVLKDELKRLQGDEKRKRQIIKDIDRIETEYTDYINERMKIYNSRSDKVTVNADYENQVFWEIINKSDFISRRSLLSYKELRDLIEK